MARMEETTTEAPARYVRRADAIKLLNISEATFDRWRGAGRIVTVPKEELDRPGVWVYREHLDNMILHADRTA